MAKRKSASAPGPLPGTVVRELTLSQYTWLQGHLVDADRGQMTFQPAHDDENGNPIPDRAIVNRDLDDQIGDLFAQAVNQDLPVPNDLDRARAQGRARIVDYADRLGAVVKFGVPSSEVESFALKELAARNYLSDSATPQDVALLQAEADVTGETLNELATVIVDKSARYRRAAGTIAGLRRKTQGLVANATTPAEVDQILRAAKTQADQALADVLQ